ncbi:MAG TPA: hypothetical protein VII06_07960 [Chloroflexota bacterium]|jgi:hypothetical protein
MVERVPNYRIDQQLASWRDVRIVYRDRAEGGLSASPPPEEPTKQGAETSDAD